MGLAQWALLLATSATFASSLFFNHILVQEIPPLTLSFLRALVALPMAYTAMRLYNCALPNRLADVMPAVFAGVLLVAIPFAAIAWGQQYIPSGLGGILYSTMPLFTIIFAQFLTADERITVGKLLGIAVSIAGVTFVIGPSVLLGGLQSQLIGQLVTLVAPISYALGTVYVRRNKHIHPLTLTAGMFFAASLVLLPVALLVEQPWNLSPGQSTIMALVALSFIGTAVPALLNYILIQKVGATNASLVMFFMPPFAVFFGYIILNEVLTSNYYLGMLLVISGSLIVTRWKPRSSEVAVAKRRL